MTTLNPAMLLDVLRHIESHTSDSGFLGVEHSPFGGVFVERGRVCWVAVDGSQARLRSLLSAYSCDAAELARVTERCCQQRRPLVQMLLGEGLLQPKDLESAIRRHSAECLVELCAQPGNTTWVRHKVGGYSPPFTFSPQELLHDSVALCHGALQLKASEELEPFREPGNCGIAFLLDGATQSLLPLAEFGCSDLGLMAELSAPLLGVTHAGRELVIEPAFTLSAAHGGRTLLSWRRHDLIFALICLGRPSLAAAVQRLSRSH